MNAFTSSAARLSRLWFLLKSLPLRARFMTGKASFVEADVRMTTNSVADASEGGGQPPAPRLLAHYQLETRRPRAGLQGWRLYDERVGGALPHRTVALTCGYCGRDGALREFLSLAPPARPARVEVRVVFGTARIAPV